MKLFFDTSALIKLFHRETRTERLQQLLLNTQTRPYMYQNWLAWNSTAHSTAVVVRKI